ncbi:MAG: hypothetical protein ACOC5T_01390 [Elusimicrobiota bacterium]
MGKSWYKKMMPTVGEILSHLPNITYSLYDIDEVKSVYLWGSTFQNIDNHKFVPKDLDIVVTTDIFSEDLTAITDDSNSPFLLKKAILEEEGYDPQAVEFTKKYIAIKDFDIDHWVISIDKKILHWGPTIENVDDWQEIKKEAEEYSNTLSPVVYKKLYKASKKDKKQWLTNYSQYINQFLSQAPKGWYMSAIKVSDVKKTMKKLSKKYSGYC